MTAGKPARVGSVLVAVGDEKAGDVLAAEFAELGWHVVGPFTSSLDALQWLSACPRTRLDGQPYSLSAEGLLDLALVDALMMDGSALRLSMALRRRGVKVASFAAFDPARRRVRAELPDSPGISREASVPELLRAFS